MPAVIPQPNAARANELQRQRNILNRELPERMILTSLGYVFCIAFIPPGPVAVLWLLNMLIELAGAVYLTTDRVLRSRLWHAAYLAQPFVLEVVYVTAAGLVWQVESPFSRAFAVGLAMTTLMHLVTVRAVHLPTGIAGLIGVAVAALVANSIFWLGIADMTGLAVSTAVALGALAYALTAMLSTHRLHRSMAAEEASARAAHEAKTLFLAQMSHELRTPLNSVIGMAQAELMATTAQDSDCCAASVERLRTLVESARTLAVILDDVTDLNAVSHGRLPLRPRVTDLAAEYVSIGATFRERAARLGIPVHIRHEGPCPAYVMIDTQRLRQCLGNLLSNSLRHAPGGAITALCSTIPHPGGQGGMLIFEVKDTGPGVPEAQRDAIFQVFHKGREAAPGTGLGLAIARGLARRMGGDLVLIASDRGAHFRLSLAYTDATAQPDLPQPPPDLAGKRVLVVDDIASNRMVVGSYLRAMNASVIEAGSGDEALSILTSEDVDLVLMDIHMPGLDGYETTARLRSMGGRISGVPIVALTADVMEDQIAAIRRSGFNGHLPKPLLPETLGAELRRLL
ncbi:MAG: response regulator [Paracoccaceae bacterium]